MLPTMIPSNLRHLRVLLLAALTAVSLAWTASPAAAVAPSRHIGSEPLTLLRSAVSSAVSSRPTCSFLTERRLTATALAIVYKEAGTGLLKAPSPMTLSRYDVYNPSGSANQRANYGLYAFGDTGTEYQRAFWHPGVGLWQLDEAGLGADYTTSERIDSSVSTAFVVDYLAGRWCAPSPGSESEGRYRAWGAWGCSSSTSSPTCVQLRNLYTELYTDGGMDRLIVDEIAALGGALTRTCEMGDGSRLACTYVDPSLAQGDRWWTSTQLTGSTPLAAPFYVTTAGGVERRTWLREDTGYPIDITAARTLGRNSRPVTSADGVRWASRSTLCDVSVSRGRCAGGGVGGELDPPTPLNVTRTTALEGRSPLVGDFTGDALDDILWYGPGGLSDELWLGSGHGTFTTRPVTVTGVYEPFVARLDDDGRDDILWYEPATGRVVRWDATGAGSFATSVMWVPAGTVPLVGDFDGDARQEIHWYGKGDVGDLFWDVPADTVVESARPVRGSYLPRVGDFDGNGVDDVVWYGPGSKPDSLWMYEPGGSRTQVIATVTGNYKPTVADLDGDHRSDIYWYAAGPASDTIWFGVDGRRWVTQSRPITGSYRLVAVDLDGTGRSALVLYQPGTGADHVWRFGLDRALADEQSVRVDGTYRVVPGRFGAASSSGGLLWAGTSPSDVAVWYP